MDLQLNGKRAIVTGGSRGIGLAVAKGLVSEGVDVVIAARNRARLQDAAQAMARKGQRVVPIQVDTRDRASVDAMVSAAVETMGGVDVLVNAAARPAGSTRPPASVRISDDEVREEIETKVLGYLRCAQAVAPHMVAQAWGRIINISGLNARWTGSLAGSVRNVAVAALTKNLADELGPQGVNVTVVHPGSTVTEAWADLLQDRADRSGVSIEEVAQQFANRTSIGRVVTSAEVANVVVFLASPRSVAVCGDAVVVSGGDRGTIHY